MASSHSAATMCNATEHAGILEAVARDRADTSETNLEVTLFHFLTYMLQDHVSICKVDEVDKISIDYDCIDAVEERLSKIKVRDYTTRQLLEHKRIWDVVTRNKEGYDKEHYFSEWCRKVARHNTATEHALPERDEAEMSAAFRSLVDELLVTELTEEQKREPKYQPLNDRSISTSQHS